MLILRDYLQSIGLPNQDISNAAAVSVCFYHQGITTLWEAISWVHQLPYGRNSQRDRYSLVFSEKKGTCSTKHALIKALANEVSVPLELNIAIQPLDEVNTPQIAAILQAHQLPAILDAHCYLSFQNHIIDITNPKTLISSLNRNTVQAIMIQPEQIGDFKLQYHQQFIKDWVKPQPPLTFEQIWSAREKYIETLY
jgi:hypothetical protein